MLVSEVSMPLIHTHAVDLATALDFVNTIELENGEPVDHLESAAAAVAWLAERGLIHDESVAAAGKGALARVQQTRAALREVVDAAFEHRPPSTEAIDQINASLRAREILQLAVVPDGLRLDHRHADDPIADAMARLAEPIAREVATGRPDRLRACADDGCRWVFYDGSPTGRRRWCDMSSCGNRAKAARHRARARIEKAAGGEPRA